MRKTVNMSTIAAEFDLKLVGPDVEIDGLGLCNRKIVCSSSILTYVVDDKYAEFVKTNTAIVCIVMQEKDCSAYSEDKIGRKLSFILSAKPEVCFYTIHEELYKRGFYDKYDFESEVGIGCNIANSAVIEKGVIIGNYVTIGANTVVRSGSVIDDNTTIGCNTTIGSEGFQLITDRDNLPMHITHVGRCHICSNVYIGDNSCVCNSLFGGETYIGEGTKIDNLVHIAHNLYVGKGAVITAHVITCGSSIIEDGAWIAPNSSILNRVTIGKCAKVGLGSVVTRDVAPYTVVYGSPAKVHEKK